VIYVSPNNEYPRFIGDIQLEHPSFQQGDNLPKGWRAVEPSVLPEVGEYEVWEELFPVETDGKLVQTFNVRPMTADEKARKDAPTTAKVKLAALGLTEYEIQAIIWGR